MFTDEAGRRCFLIPAAAAIPSGVFVLVGPDGSQRFLSEAAVAPFEIHDEEIRRQAEAVIGLSRMASRRTETGEPEARAAAMLDELVRAMERIANGEPEPPLPSREEVLADYRASARDSLREAIAQRPIQPAVSFLDVVPPVDSDGSKK